MSGVALPRLPAAWRASLDAGRVVVCWQTGPGGRPRMAETAREMGRRARAELAGNPPAGVLRMSRTATDGIAGLALAWDLPVGLDAEAPGATAPDGEAMALALHPDESAGVIAAADFLWLWTRKEAVLKALGTGLALDPRRIRTGGRADDWRRVDSPWGGEAHVVSIEAPGGVPAALAVLGGTAEVAIFGPD